ncbi:MAG: BolA family transcriptional regulator, partial [Sphingomonadales bacterium]|nr:BolA family transcriptional regulator [Sphingomonadales bacterium]
MSMTDTIRTKLTDAFSPVELNVIDESEQHRGHGGYREGGESHFRVEMKAEAFNGKSRVERQRMVNHVLAEELKEQIHALS